MNRAWLLTRVDVEGHNVVDTFLALLDAAIPSVTMLQIIEALYQSSIQSPQLSGAQPEYAQYRILNDGSPHTGYIVCGHNPSLNARLVYEIIITSDTNQSYNIQWHEAHMLLQDGIRKIEYWEDFSVTMLRINDYDIPI